MKRILFATLALVLIASLAWGWMGALVGGGVAATAPAGYCSGSELFCEDFEGDDTTWDATNGTSDCDGYDADGDYCDDESTVYKNGSQAFGCRGADTNYVREALSTTDIGELYMEGWFRHDNVSGARNGPGVYTHHPYPQVVIQNSWGTIRVITKGGAVSANTSITTAAANTWYHYGIYYKAETGDSANDGILRVWINTDGGSFDASDVVLNSSAVDTGTIAAGYGADLFQLTGAAAGYIAYADDPVVKSGAPAWAY